VKVIVVGGGKVGGFLAHELLADGHSVTVIERDMTIAGRLAEGTKALVIEGDGSDVDRLRSAETERADWVLAVTGNDQDNLVACELAATLGAGHVLARLNDPRNRRAFETLDIPVVAVTDLMGQVISREVETEDLQRIALLGRGRISLIEVEIPRGTEERRVFDLPLPPETLIVSVTRAGSVEIAHGDTVIGPGNRVVAVTGVDQETDVRAVLCPPGHD